MNILIAICGLGNPGGDDKKKGCLNNLKILRDTAPKNANIFTKIFCYDDLNVDIFNDIDNCEIIRESGVIGEFIYRHLTPDKISIFDKVVLILDDINLKDNCNLSKMIEIQEKFKFNIISPSASKKSKLGFDFMKHDFNAEPSSVFSVNYLEFFMYLFDIKNGVQSYQTWHSLINENTKWLWGIDLILNKVFNMKLGLINDMQFDHLQFGGSTTDDSWQELHDIENKLNCEIVPGKNLKRLAEYKYDN